jgi:L-rhamnose isomerase
MTTETTIEKTYNLAKEKYAEMGVDVQKAMDTLNKISISLHCWQGDDVGGFESPDAELSGGGIQVTGNYPGKARNVEELRMDAEKAFSLIPGNHRFNLHAIYGEFGGKKVDRDEITTDHFKGWLQWAKQVGIKLDFNATCFSHPKAEDGFTLSSKDESIRKFWIEHVNRCREISASFGKELGSSCIHNLWIPDGMKDIPVDRWTYRELLKKSLDEVFEVEYEKNEMKDAIESKLFGIGSESFVVGSHEFYMGYGISREKMVCLDMGHFHPTESIADKISAILQFSDELLFHVSRGVRWDSDHTVILNDDVKAVCEELVRANALDRVNIALDFFDATLNRIGAWVIGTRATLKALLMALLEPHDKLKNAEEKDDYFERLALLEELKTMPFGAVWDYYCLKQNVPFGEGVILDVLRYEAEVLGKRIINKK